MSKIVIVTNQFSVVVKGLERKLTDLGHQVKSFAKGFLSLSDHDYETDVLLLYLMEDLLDKPERIHELNVVCDKSGDGGCAVIIIGPGQNRELFLKSVPRLKNFPWVDVPPDMKLLSKEIEKATQGTPQSKMKNVLVVDDDPIYGKMVSSWLGETYAVSTLSNGMNTISFVTNNQVDLILLDYEMPVIDGPKILEMLRSHPQTSPIPVIFLTGVRDKESIQRVLDLKPEGYILKSATKAEILKKLADFFEKREK